jgi:hypothetical protein
MELYKQYIKSYWSIKEEKNTMKKYVLGFFILIGLLLFIPILNAADQNTEYIFNRVYDSTNEALKVTISGDANLSSVTADALYLNERTAPGTPPNGRGVFYVKSADSKPYYKTDGGIEYNMLSADETSNLRQSVINLIIGNGTDAITQQIMSADIAIPYSGTISKWEVKGNTIGALTMDVLKAVYGGAFTTIAGTEKPSLISQAWNTDTSLTTWTTAVNAGDWLKISLDSVTTLKQATISIYITKS